MKHVTYALALLALLGACDGDGETDGTSDEYDGSPIPDPAEFCDALAEVMCYKLTCYTEEERAAQDLPATEQECVDGVLVLCTPETVCEPGFGLTYQPDLAGACIDEIEALTCEDTRDSDLGEPGPSCAEMCQ